MKDKIKQFLNILYRVWLSFLGTGYAPKAPGTVGSAATIPLLFPFVALSLTWKLAILIPLTIVTCMMAQHIQQIDQSKDPQWIVADEVLGMLTTVLLLNQITWKSALIAFGIFRVFDIVKIWPASYFDKLNHGAGTILDDIVSGIFSLLTLFIINKFLFNI